MKILLVDDHEMVRLGLKSYLDLQVDIDVVAESADGRAGVEKALELRPDVIVMDIVMPEMNGIESNIGYPQRVARSSNFNFNLLFR